MYDEPTRGNQQFKAASSIPYDHLQNSRLESGCVRYVRIPRELNTDTVDTIRFETCIRRNLSHVDPSKHLNLGQDSFTYSAVSYAWGNPTPKHQIFVDGESHQIAENLWQFLLQAKAKPELLSGWLWIDALSIDQSDPEERRHQVGIMSSIFQNAYQVFVWLGPALENSDVAMSALSASSMKRYVFEQFYLPNNHDLPEYNWLTRSESIQKLKRWEPERFEEWATGVANAIGALCDRPYWKRLWVFQELRHAEQITITCGEQIVPWDKFGNLWSVLAEIGALNEHTVDMLKGSLATRMVTLRAKPMDFSLWNLLKETRNLACWDRRDRVYALLSVATEGHEGIEADYRKTTTPLTIAHDTLRHKYAMRSPRTLDDVLADCEFLEDVFGMLRSEMLQYARVQSSGQVIKWSSIGQQTSVLSFPRVETTRSSRNDRGWSEWAQSHGHLAVAELLGDMY